MTVPIRRKVLFSVLMWSGTLLVCGAIAELAIRKISPESDLRRRDLMFRYEPFIGQEGIPNKTGIFATSSFKTTVVHNSEGFRDVEHDQRNTRGKFRILTLGDSFTWGHGVENDEIYMRVLERLDDRIEAINMGGSGANTMRELKVYTARGRAYDHDVVLVGFFLGNDVMAQYPTEDTAPPQWGFDADGDFRLIGRMLPPEEVEAIREESASRYSAVRDRGLFGGLRYWLIRNVQLLTFLDNSRDYYSDLLKGTVLYTRVARALGFDNRRSLHFLKYAGVEDPPEVEYGWRLVAAALQQLRVEAEASDARLYVVLIPDRLQTSPLFFERWVRRYGYEPEEYDVDKPVRRIVEICESLGIPYLDLLPSVRAAVARGEDLYFIRDSHWNPRGHELAAREIHADLVARGWLE